MNPTNAMKVGVAALMGLLMAACSDDSNDPAAAPAAAAPAPAQAPTAPYLSVVEEAQDGIPTRFCVVADLNGDGYDDLVVGRSTVDPNGPAGVASIYLSDAEHQVPASASGALALDPATGDATAADFNGDGRIDLAVSVFSDATGGRLEILAGNGDGTFQAATTVVTGFDAVFIGSADFNGDGAADLVASGSIETRIYPNQGTATFGSPSSLPFPSYFAPIDTDGDGRSELAVIEWMWDSFVKIYQDLLGAPAMAAALPVPADHIATSLDTADMDEDGDADLVTGTVNQTTWADGVARLFTNADAAFGTWTDTSASAPIFRVAALDYNGDGRQDLAWYSEGTTSSIGFAIAGAEGLFEATPWTVATDRVSVLESHSTTGCACGRVYFGSDTQTVEIHGGTSVDQQPSWKNQ